MWFTFQKVDWGSHKGECPCLKRVTPDIPLDSVRLMLKLVIKHQVSCTYHYGKHAPCSFGIKSRPLMRNHYFSLLFFDKVKYRIFTAIWSCNLNVLITIDSIVLWNKNRCVPRKSILRDNINLIWLILRTFHKIQNTIPMMNVKSEIWSFDFKMLALFSNVTFIKAVQCYGSIHVHT